MPVKRVTISQLAESEEMPRLEREYTEECAHELFKTGEIDWDTYLRMENAGLLAVFGVYDHDARLQGFAVLVRSKSLHKGIKTCILETVFVSKAERKFGLGGILLERCRRCAKTLGAKVLIVNAPTGSDLALAMSMRLGGPAYQSYFWEV